MYLFYSKEKVIFKSPFKASKSSLLRSACWFSRWHIPSGTRLSQWSFQTLPHHCCAGTTWRAKWERLESALLWSSPHQGQWGKTQMQTDNPSRLPNFPRLILKISYQYLIMLNTSADKPSASVKLCFYRLCCSECSQTQPLGWLSGRKEPAQPLRAGPSANRTNQRQNSDSWRKFILLRDKLKIYVVISIYYCIN